MASIEWGTVSGEQGREWKRKETFSGPGGIYWMVFNGEGRNGGKKASTAYTSLDSMVNRVTSHELLTAGRHRSLKSSVV